MRIALLADAFPPMRSSAAVQLRDLAREFQRQGHRVTVMIPASGLDRPWLLDDLDGVEVLRLKALPTKDISYLRRTLGEFLMPHVMLRNLRKSPLAGVRWDGVVWYSPSIFLGPIVKALKKASACRSYLIVRDIFPEWAVDMGLMRRGLPYRVFKQVERYQYSVADVIGAQTSANLPYFERQKGGGRRRLEVLQNWLAPAADKGCRISVSAGPLAGRTLFVYAGNMGVAQGMDILLALAERMRARRDIGFLFVGRGRDAQRLRRESEQAGLDNVVFHDEIDPEEIPGLYAQCHVGIVVLDPRHKTHNIPGKFLSYMQAGLPVLAALNAGNDLIQIIRREGVGRASTDYDVATLEQLVCDLAGNFVDSPAVHERCCRLAETLFSPAVAVGQIVDGLCREGT